MQNVLKVNNLIKNYGNDGSITKVLHGIDFSIEHGEFVAIMGPSGSGKTTLLNLLSTIDTPSSGEIKLDGEDILNLNDRALSKIRQQKMGFIFQDYNLLDTLTIKENILLPLAIAKVKVKEIEELVKNVTEKLAIEHILNHYPYQVSGGQQQRTAIARALITTPSIIFADEPTGALDSKSALNLLESLTDLNQKHDATILMVTHDAFAASFCQRILFIKDGTIFTEIYKGQKTRQQFYQEILENTAVLGGN